MHQHAASHNPESAGTAKLIGYGRLGWAELVRAIGTAQTAWADYDGFHIGAAPAEPPPYSHLWAWTGQWLLRARIDGAQAITGVLVLTEPPHGAPAVKVVETVRYERAHGHTWPPGEKRIGPLAVAITDRGVDIYMVRGERPVTFVAVRPAR